MIYVCKNDGDYDGLSNIRLSVLRRLIIETNGLRHWVPEWAAVSLKPLYYCWYMRQWDMYFVKILVLPIVLSMGEVAKMLEGSMDIDTPPIPRTVLERAEEGLEQVYKAM
ncbi:hypothetical protein V6N13_042112 [Hibiscus sabdariffa]